MLDDLAIVAPSPLLTAGRVLAERGVYGLVWFDEALVVTARFGRIVGGLEVGEPLLHTCLPLIGLENDIRALRDSPGRVFDLPAVKIATNEDDAPRVNLTVFWHHEGKHYLMLMARTTSRSDIEGELSQQMRARLIAEAEVAQKSRELARANAELARANRDLEDFAAIISHDLKSPLRALRYASEDMARHLEDGDHQAARARLDEIGTRTRRMSDLMTSLLEYASVGRKSEIAEPVDTRQVVEDVVRSLAVPDGFTIRIEGEWPRFETVGAALDLVLRNLVQNAILHHDRTSGHVIVSAADTAKSLVVVVADDGPGIAPEHHATILLPFRSLSTKSGSTGMGLAFVNRTIETIGGSMTVESNPLMTRGTRFRLLWPKTVKS